MSRLPQVTPRQMMAVLNQADFVLVRVKGSHHFFVHITDPTRWTTVPMHNGDLRSDTVRDILKQTRLSRDDFTRLL
jgi:predicted RNA binding protein YcfA (HicA-like mRNA interferase family)